MPSIDFDINCFQEFKEFVSLLSFLTLLSYIFVSLLAVFLGFYKPFSFYLKFFLFIAIAFFDLYAAVLKKLLVHFFCFAIIFITYAVLSLKLNNDSFHRLIMRNKKFN